MNPIPAGAEPPISVLIVEDTLGLLRLYSHILSQAGFQIHEAASGEAALQLLWDQRPDLVLLDRVLPDMDGSDICGRIKQHPELASTYVIMLSALKTTEDDRVSGLEAGADDYIVKPVGRRELLARVQVASRLKRTQLALETSEAMFRTLAENSPDVIGRFDRDMRCIYVNRTVEDITGRSPAAYLGKTLAEIDRDDSMVQVWRSALSGVFESGEAARLEFELPTGADTRIFDAHLVPEYDSEGNISSILSVARDFTDHVRAEQQIARLAIVVEQAVEAVVITDPHGRIVYANAAFENMTGISSAAVDGELLQELQTVYSEDFCNQFRSLIATHSQWSGSSQYSCRHGRICEAEVSVFPITDRGGQIIDYAVIQRDVTERQRVEREREALLNVAAALRKAETRAEMLPIVLDQIMSALNLSGALFIALDLDTGESLIEMAHGDHESVRGLRLSGEQAIAPDAVDTGAIYVNNSISDDDRYYVTQFLGNPVAVAAVPLMAQNHLVSVLWIGSRDSISDQALGILLAVVDMAANAIHRADLYEEIQRYAADLELMVAERTRALAEANEQLLELDRLKSKFVSNVSHELRTPISNLKLYVALLQRGKPERRAQYESMLRISVDRLGQLVEDILNLSRLEIAHQQSRSLESTDLNAVIRQVVTLHHPQAESAGIRLLYEPERDLPLISGDYNQLSQLVTNLIVNALNYTREGHVRIVTSLVESGTSVRLMVEDTGIGILPEDLPHLFDRFYRGNHRQPDNIPGTGLGLAIVREIVDIHDGTISVQSEVDQGTKIEVHFPAQTWKDGFSLSWLRPKGRSSGT